MKNVNTTLTTKDINLLVNLMTQQLTVLQMTDSNSYNTESHKNMTTLQAKLNDLMLEVAKN